MERYKMTQPNARFLILAAENMLDLLSKMQTQSHPLAQLKYIGRNEGDYSHFENQELVKATQFIAVFDFTPVYIVELSNVQVIHHTDDLDGLEQVQVDMETTMSA
jgi:hypothetical protein